MKTTTTIDSADPRSQAEIAKEGIHVSDEKTIDSDAERLGQPVADPRADLDAYKGAVEGQQEDYSENVGATPGQIGPEDLVICADDGKFYWVTKEKYMKELLPHSLLEVPKRLCDDGAVLSAAKPEPRITGGAACYILNLPLVRKPKLP